MVSRTMEQTLPTDVPAHRVPPKSKPQASSGFSEETPERPQRERERERERNRRTIYIYIYIHTLQWPQRSGIVIGGI